MRSNTCGAGCECPEDSEAKELWGRYEAEFGREDADTPLARDTSGEGFHALREAERRAGHDYAPPRGRGGFAGLLLGSVSQQCAQHPPCPVVILPPVEEESSGDG